MSDKTILYKIDSKQNIRFWSIRPDYDEEGFWIKHGQLDGKTQEKFIEVFENLSGRDIYEQIDLRVESRIARKRDGGYCDSIEEARSRIGRNASGNLRPMTAQVLKDRFIDFEKDIVFVQKKYDGHRCLIHIDNGKVEAYSRKGRKIVGIDHILEPLKKCKTKIILDGELYIHGMSFQKLSSLIKKKQEESNRIEFICYDCIRQDENFFRRLEYARNILTLQEIKSANISFASTIRVYNMDICRSLFKQYRESGYEGAMIRISKNGYEPGKRSRQLLKLKEFLDEEFKIESIVPSKDGWARLNCSTEKGVMFGCSAPGTISNKKKMLREKQKYIGKMITIKFSHWTNEGKPFQPIAVRLKEDI